MSASRAPRAGRREGGKRRFAMAVGVVAGAALALAMAAPAWATPSVTVTPLGPGNFPPLFVTITNPGPETITGYIVSLSEENYAINIATGQVCQFGPWLGLKACEVAVAPATSAQVCFAGSAATELYPGLEMLIRPGGGSPYRIKASASSVAPPCPFAPGVGSGSTSGTSGMPGTSGTPGSGSGGGSSATPATPSKGAHSWSRARCKSTYKAWAKKHRRATRRQKKAEAATLHKAHGCPLSILK